MLSVGGQRETDGMSETIPSPASPDSLSAPPESSPRSSWRRSSSRRSRWALLAVPAIGCAVTVANAIAAIAVTRPAGGFILFGSDVGPHTPADVYASTHHADAYLTSHPLILAASFALIVAATGLATIRRRVAATLLLCAAAVMPWFPAIAFLHHLLQLTGH
jgi:hypothetical protein